MSHLGTRWGLPSGASFVLEGDGALKPRSMRCSADLTCGREQSAHRDAQASRQPTSSVSFTSVVPLSKPRRGDPRTSCSQEIHSRSTAHCRSPLPRLLLASSVAFLRCVPLRCSDQWNAMFEQHRHAPACVYALADSLDAILAICEDL
jgi:hypothetical protein